VADSLAEATKGATILTTVTSAHEPLLDLETVGSVAALAYERSGERRPA
jgi:ornithine cyclodeaminase/alanine dehydrogenase-like protein (mu-crystallin family)